MSGTQARGRRIVLAALTGLILAGAWSPGLSHAAPSRAKWNARDLSGVWQLPAAAKAIFDEGAPSVSEEAPPYRPEWAKEYAEIKRRVAAGMRIWDPSVKCLPPGMPKTMNAFYPFEILMTPGRVTILTEFFNEIRRIWTDGRGHPPRDELEPTFSGHSIGHWEGDTLVVHTIGLRYDSLIDLTRAVHSDQIEVTERIRRVAPDTLETTMTLVDPVVFERPWTSTKHFVRQPPETQVREYICGENNQMDAYTPGPNDEKYLQPDPRLKTLP